jgi:predicted RNase H-like HicB family nuclease
MEPIKKTTYHLPILLEQDDDGVYIVSCPSFRGCHSYGHTVEEAMENIREVIEMCVQEEGPVTENKFIGFREIEFQLV